MGIENAINNLVDQVTIKLERVAVRVGAIEVYDGRGRRIKRPKSRFDAPQQHLPPRSEPRIVQPKPRSVRPVRLALLPRRQYLITPRRPRIAR